MFFSIQNRFLKFLYEPKTLVHQAAPAMESFRCARPAPFPLASQPNPLKAANSSQPSAFSLYLAATQLSISLRKLAALTLAEIG
jgi:hypothetical protein